jgi:uncharacterized protein YndB with AHSA1/START domain
MNALQLTVPPNTQSMSWTREIDAPRDVVFAVMTDPDALPQWWGPSNLSTTVLEHEARTGGSWKIEQTDPDGNTYGFRGVFHEVVPGERIVQTFEFDGMPGHVTLDTLTLQDSDAGRTLVTGSSVFQSVEDRDGMVASGMEGGMAEGYDRLEALAQARR